MKLPSEVFDSGDEAWGGTIDGIADRGVATIAHRIEQTPAGKIGKSFGTMRRCAEMRFHKDQEFRLKTDDFLEIDLRPVLRGVDDGGGAGLTERIGDERVVADGDEWFGPNNEENATRRQRRKAVVEGRKLVFEIGGERGADFRGAEEIGKTGMPISSRAWTVSLRFRFLVTSTRSGCRAAMASRLGLTAPPTFVFCWASGGKSQ